MKKYFVWFVNKTHYFFRECIVHYDINETNLIVQEEFVQGIIDLEPLIKTKSINGLAGTIANLLNKKSNPFDLILKIVESYYEIIPFSIEEIQGNFEYTNSFSFFLSICFFQIQYLNFFYIFFSFISFYLSSTLYEFCFMDES
jgi:hypothetical protein